MLLQIKEILHKMQQFELYAGEEVGVSTLSCFQKMELVLPQLTKQAAFTFTTLVLKGSETEAALCGALLVFHLV